MKLKKRPMKLKPKPKEPAGKLDKAQKQKQNAAKLASAEKVMAQFESGSVDTKKKTPKANGTPAPKKANHSKPEAPNQKRQLKKLLGQDGLLVKHQEGQKWYSYQIDHVHDEKTDKMSSADIHTLLEEGKDALAQDAALLQTKDKQENGSEASWLYSVISKGTAADKRTAMQLQMHKSPVHSLEYVERLIASCKKQGTRDVVDIIPILEDVFINHCLPDNRKLIPFSKRALTELTELSSGNQRTRRKILLMWAFENELKILYQQFLETLVEIIKRPLEEVIKRSLKTLANCLMGRPEAENLILSSLVNTFGHPNYKIGSFVVVLLEGVSRKHPAMRMVMVEEIERLAFRKNVNERAHLYSITFLSQMKFQKKDSDLCCRLMSIYLSLFKTLVGKKITENRLLPIILAGANRAFPFAKDVDKLLEDVKDIYFLAHNSNYRTAIPALKLLFQFHKMNDYVSDRFYNALYRKLMDNCPPGAYAQLLKLMYDTMKEDASAQRVRSFVKRLLQVAVNSQPDFAASILLLVSRLQKLRGTTEHLIVLSKDIDPAARVVSRMQNDDEDEERYVDLDTEGNEIARDGVKKEEADDKNDVVIEEDSDEKKKVEAGKLGASSSGGWVHRNMGTRGAKSPYDSVARNPLFVDASRVADSELLLLANHYHPSVGVFAKALLEGREINYGGEALNDFTLMAFLDRFAFRNPKEVVKSSGGRIVRKKAHDPWGVRKLAVGSNEYTKKRPEEIPADERFLHRYTSSLNKDRKTKKEEGEDEWEYADSVNSEEFDQLLERFEPGELNEEFDIDYSKEFGAEKNKRGKKKAAEEDDVDMDEDDDDIDLNDLNEEEDGGVDDDEDEGGDDDDDDNDEDDEGDEDDDGEEDDDDEGDFGGKSSANIFGEDDSSDEEIGDNDYEMAGDKFAEMLEDMEEEDDKGKKKGGKKGGFKKGVKRDGGGFKKGGGGGAKRFRRH